MLGALKDWIIWLQDRYLYPRAKTKVERLRMMVFYYLVLAIFVECSITLLGVTNVENTYVIRLTWILLGTAVVLFIGCGLKAISINPALDTLLLFIQARLCFIMMHCTVGSSAHPSDALVILHLCMCVFLLFFAVAAHLIWCPIILSVTSIAAYGFCIYQLDSHTLEVFFPIYIIFTALVTVFGLRMVYSVHTMEEENTALKEESQHIAEELELDNDELLVLLELSSKTCPEEDRLKELLSMMRENSRIRLIKAVDAYMKMKDTQDDILRKVFPEMTPSELTICRLILRGKKMGEICTILNKTTGNITSQRAHIRSKLGLKPADDLLKALEDRVNRFTGIEKAS
ncbi:hypothetical protein [uncultured Bacteroides sp.]|uniref:hypothetical protein n=1 Tax=uncultured Bacteroides sp. TaxID=162156 RepID=UPI0026147BB9|nr:hypothetical protein [uncultured Bacteroides sp.]